MTGNRVVVYTRVSTDKEEQKKSLENQMQIYTDYCNHKNLELVEIYADERSGTNARRKGFIRMMYDAGLNYIKDDENVDTFVTTKREPKFDLIIVKDTTRFSRNAEIAESVVKRLMRMGVQILFENVNLKTSDENWGLIGSFLFKMGENESASLGKKIRQTKYYNAINMRYRPARLPYGYTWDEERNIVKVPEQAEIVERIYNSYAKKGSMILTKELNNEGIKTQKGHEWSGDKITRIIKNRIYTGTAVVNRSYKANVTDTKRLQRDESEYILIPNAVPSIVTLKQYEEVNKIRESRINKSDKNRRGRKISYDDIYFQKIKCGSCGKGFKKHTTIGSGKKKKINYMCMGRAKGNNCNTRGIALNNLDKGLSEITINSHVESIKEQVEFMQLMDRLEIELERIEESRSQLQEELSELKSDCDRFLSTIDSYRKNGQEKLALGFEIKYDNATLELGALETQLADISFEKIQRLKIKVEHKKELIQQLTHSKSLSNEGKLKLLKKVVVTDYELEYFFTMPNYDDEIQEFNSIFKGNPIENGFQPNSSGITVRRNHKEAREYFKQLIESYEDWDNFKRDYPYQDCGD
ncbi:recombinase family protein [Sporosarcina sp. BI001-red]|uniref:recombinase family protein n=1 Tax=Sporosarcina sp. BI001-red TaxID=2282866 RepID=UPI000E252D29|nr:recombinase family protein [Sporosarcina sp. BI001-red]REB10036.1 recombinase family protein [Sporosarcina sp. BI001-red]